MCAKQEWDEVAICRLRFSSLGLMFAFGGVGVRSRSSIEWASFG